VEDVDFEQFLAFLDLEYFLGLRGSDTWSSGGNESQIIVKTLLAQILVERTPARDGLPAFYYDFAASLEPNDYVLTFNYDVILERALEAVGKPFRLFPDRFESVHTTHGVVDSSRQEVVVLKLHGSVDWFDRRTYAELEEGHMELGVSSKPRHPVFGPESGTVTVPLLEGPQFPHEPLRSMHRVLDVESLYSSNLLFRATPWLLSPSATKFIFANTLKRFWWGLGRAGRWNLGVVIIGYSLPPHDDYARQALFRLIKNFQESWWDEEFAGTYRKQPVLLIDRRLRPDDVEGYRRRYGFVDPEKAVYHLKGFDEAAVCLIREASQASLLTRRSRRRRKARRA
jgi:hypothetical protein